MDKAGFEERWPELMSKAQGGDKDAYRQLLDEIGPRVYWYLKRRLRKDEDAADLYQTVILNLHAGRHTYDVRQPFEPWLFAITRHVLSRYLKKQHKEQNFVDLVDMIDAGGDPMSERTVESMIAEAMEKMSAEQQKAFKLVKIEGMSLEEAAKSTGCTVAAIKTRTHRAYQIFKQAVMETR